MLSAKWIGFCLQVGGTTRIKLPTWEIKTSPEMVLICKTTSIEAYTAVTNAGMCLKAFLHGYVVRPPPPPIFGIDDPSWECDPAGAPSSQIQLTKISIWSTCPSWEWVAPPYNDSAHSFSIDHTGCCCEISVPHCGRWLMVFHRGWCCIPCYLLSAGNQCREVIRFETSSSDFFLLLLEFCFVIISHFIVHDGSFFFFWLVAFYCLWFLI